MHSNFKNVTISYRTQSR